MDVEDVYIEEFTSLCRKTQAAHRNYEEYQNSIVRLADCVLQHEDRTEIIRNCLHKVTEVVPLEVLWLLQEKGLVHFPAYLSLNPEFVPEISASLTELVFSQKFYIVINLLVPTLVSSLHFQREIHYPAQYLLDFVLKNFVDRLLKDDVDCTESIGKDYVHQLVTAQGAFRPCLKTFILGHLRLVLSYPGSGDQKPVISINDAFTIQSKNWIYSKTPKHISLFLREILTSLEPDDVIKEIHSVVMDSEIDEQFSWRWLLVTISVFVVCVPQSAGSVKKALDEWLIKTLTDKDQTKLGAVILMVRQCYAEQIKPVFSSYTNWFSTLGSSVTAPSAFVFLIEYLMQLVPYEPTLYLKIHINKVPSAPQGVHAILSDYVALAKTRLADLNETSDYVGLFGEFNSSEQESTESDIARVLAHFKETGEVMRTVIEASVFRRDYYERVFLRELLKTTEQNPLRFKFIDRLYAIGKCPGAMYADWSKRKTNQI